MRPLTLTVSVAENCPASVTNTATVSGGGETEHLQRHGHRHQQRRGGRPGHYRHHALAFRRHGRGRADHACGQLQRGHDRQRRQRGGHRRELSARDRGARRALFRLRSACRSLSVSYSGTTATLTFSALTQNIYRLTVLDTIDNTAGVALDGNGTSPSNWVTRFRRSAQPCRAGQRDHGHRGNNALCRRGGRLQRRRHADLAVANSASNTVSILLGKGSGGFSPPRRSSPPAFPTIPTPWRWAISTPTASSTSPWPATRADLATARSRSSWATAARHQHLLVHRLQQRNARRPRALRTGRRQFRHRQSGPGGGKLRQQHQPDGIQILLNNGSGVFTALTQYTTGINDPDAVAVADFNGDGHLDVAVANNTAATTLRSCWATAAAVPASPPPPRTVPASPTPPSLAVADLNGDG